MTELKASYWILIDALIPYSLDVCPQLFGPSLSCKADASQSLQAVCLQTSPRGITLLSGAERLWYQRESLQLEWQIILMHEKKWLKSIW